MKDLFRRKPVATKPRKRSPQAKWYTPSDSDVYAQVKVAQTMLMRIPDADLAVLKREMYILEDMLWQFSKRGEMNGKPV